MNDERSFERFVADHVAGAAGQSRVPDDLYDDLHAFASRTRQWPAWLALLKEPPMRINSTVGVGSPIARIAVILASTMLVALLGVGALVAGAQSPSPVPSEVPPDAPSMSFFSGELAEAAGGACQIAEGTSETVAGVTQTRGTSWGCQVLTTDDPRLSGETTFIWNMDVPASGPAGEIVAGRQRIENETGSWEGTFTELSFQTFHQQAGWFSGEGAYDGLLAYVVLESRPGGADVWGVVRPDDGFGPPDAFVVE